MKLETLLIIALVGFGVYQFKKNDVPAPPAVSVTGYQVPESLKPFAADMAASLKDQPDKAKALAALYAALADAIERDAGTKVKSTGVLREVLKRSGEVKAVGNSGVAVGPKIAAKIGEHAGLSDGKGGYVDIEIDAAKRAKVIEVLRTVSAAAGGK